MRKLRGKEIGFIFQDPLTSLNPTLTIGYQIGEVDQGAHGPVVEGVQGSDHGAAGQGRHPATRATD